MNQVIYIVCNVIAEILLILCGAFFTSSETAYTSITKIQIRMLQRKNIKNADLVFKLKSSMDTLICFLLIGTNFITTLISSLSTAFALNVFGSKYVSYVTALVSIVVIVFLEIIPKTYASLKPKKVSIGTSRPIYILQKVFFPAVWLFSSFTNLISKLESKFFKQKNQLITDDELKTLLEVGEAEGTIDQDSRKMLDRIFEFTDLNVHDIMHHRSMVKYLNVNATYSEAIETFTKSGYSRLPVYDGQEENVIGVLHYKNVLFASMPILESKDFVRICMRDVMFVPETFSALELLDNFKKHKSDFAVAINEYGSLSGIVTMDDILREVFGRITDEYGTSEVPPETRVKVCGVNEFLIPGDMKLDDLNEVLNLNLDSENYDTVAGWLLERFDELPKTGSVYKYEKIVFIVEDQSLRRIQSVRIKFV